MRDANQVDAHGRGYDVPEPRTCAKIAAKSVQGEPQCLSEACSLDNFSDFGVCVVTTTDSGIYAYQRAY